jgi:hypothetical protein
MNFPRVDPREKSARGKGVYTLHKWYLANLPGLTKYATTMNTPGIPGVDSKKMDKNSS